MTFDRHHPSVYAPFEAAEFGSIHLPDKLSFISEAMNKSSEPIFIYSKCIVEQRIALLRNILPVEIGIHYAVKSNPFAPLLSFIAPLVDGFDIASGGELKRLIAAELADQHVSFAGPGKSEEEISLALDHGVVLIAESSYQLATINRLAAFKEMQAPVMVRINDHQQVSGTGLSMSGANSFFGIDKDEFSAIVPVWTARFPHLSFTGLHLFHGSQNLNLEALQASLMQTADLISNIDVPNKPKIINIGGGLGIPYAPKDRPLDVGRLKDAYARVVDGIRTRFGHVKICTELGRFISGPAGLYVCRVLDKKSTAGNTFIVTNGGLHHFSAATGNFGQVLKKNHPIWPLHPNLDAPDQSVTISGRLCTPIDVFAKGVTLPPLEIGDALVFFQAGAYGPTASPGEFLSHPGCREILA
jgi:diaminopimelate decarboxylase